ISKCNSSLVQYNLNFTKLSNRIILFNVGNDDMAYMYSSDGTVSSTVLLKEFSSLSQTLCYIKLVENGKLYFDGISLESNTSAEDFFVSDGTVSGTYSLYSEETKFSNVISAVAFNDKIYFKAYDGIEWSLYTTDGTVAGTVMTPYKSNSLDGITVQNDLLLVTSYTGVYGEQMSNDGMWVFTKEEGLNLTNDYYRLFDQAGSFYTCNLYATPDKIFFIGNTVATSSEPFLFTPNDRVVTSSVAHGSEESVVNLYPNPVTDQMTWEYKGSDAIIKMHLRDINGKSVSAWNNSVTTIDMSSLVQGVYILEVEWENSKQVLKVVKK
ncbi:MAG: hypothetical protein K0R51_2996, partial [Cytophagaceae bacterium]|nr:hypothetical protein [Cytophagaceae bacterium]